ncbi:unnamed protein product [Echinostoma caproni]|uniref:5'-nucleotidase n=1 Tax=Echinostoma caproni TaxID=27848 RepID=A0A183AET5_9TREM|nr:unnamed protein product [Echinostoma caproni]
MGNAESITITPQGETIQAEILHFNDVYNVEETSGDLCGGAARFTAAFTELRSRVPENTLLLFSGDALSPSSLSMTTEGSHMIDVLNRLNLDCAVIGNHDFDFGIDNLLRCIKQSNFPWLNGNCYDAHTRQLLCDLPPCHVIERGGIRYGLIGLVEPDWVDTLAVVDQDDVLVRDFCVEGRRIATQLRHDEDCDIIVALTHMRWPNDIRLAREVPEIDLVLGGHDHNYGFETVKSKDGTNRWVIKSGTDFRHLGHVHLILDAKTKRLKQVKFDLIPIDKSWTPDPEVAKMVETVSAAMNERLSRVIGKIDVPLDGRFAMIRSQETNMGNFLADVALTATEADCAIINSGSMRIDAIVPSGDFTLKQLSLILPMLNPTMVLDVTGNDIIQVLENGVSQIPKLEGRFPQVSRITFSYRADRPKGERVNRDSIKIEDKPLVLERHYRLACTPFMAEGKDGYDILAKKRRLVDDEAGIPLSTAVINYFRTISVLNGFTQSKSSHRPGLLSMKQRNRVTQALLASVEKFAKQMTSDETANASERAAARWAERTQAQLASKLKEKILASVGELIPETNIHSTKEKLGWSKIRETMLEKEKERCRVAPRIEGRIVRLDAENKTVD